MPLVLGEDKISRVVTTIEAADGGINTNDATLTSGAQMLSGVTSYSNGKKYTGTIPTVTAPTPTVSVSAGGTITASVENPYGYQASNTTKTVTTNLSTQDAKIITPNDSTQIAVNSGVYTTGAITVAAVPTETKSITANGTFSPTSGSYFSSVTVNVPSEGATLQEKTVTPSEATQTISPDAGYDGLSSVTVGAISSTYIGSGIAHKSATTYTPTESEQTISAGQYLDGDQTIAAISSTYVGSDVIRKSAATITPTESEQVISAGQYLDGTQTISAIPSTYIGSGVPTQDTVTITPNTSAQTAVSAGTYVTGDVLVAEIPENYVDTSDANAASSDMVEGVTAYVNGEKKTGTMSSLVGNSNVVFSTSIEQPIGVNGFTQDVYIRSDAVTENMYVPSGDIVTITIPVTRREEVLGNVQASEVLAGKTFISNSNITSMSGYTAMIGTGTMPSKDAATFTPGTTDQTIDAGQYLSGAQTIQGDANLVPENIISGKSIFGVSGSVVIQKYYTGATEPSSSLGNDGDLYFKA